MTAPTPTPEDRAEAEQAQIAQTLRTCQTMRNSPTYRDGLRLRASFALDRYKAMREAGFDRIDALYLLGNPFA